jgi:hypothetical protein
MAADPNKNVDSSNDNALDNSKVMHISAKDGGRYVSADGLLTATFPPGSLSEDTDVKLVRVETKDLKNSDVFLNGIRYQWDLGTAYIMPGTKVTVTSKADDRLVPALKAMYTDFTMERYSLSKDDKGNYNVTMKYEGTKPSVPKPADGADLGESPTRGTMQEGSFPITVSGSDIFKQDSRIEAFCNYAPPPLRATRGYFCSKVTWEAPGETTSPLAGKNAFGVDLGADSNGHQRDCRVYVVYSTNYVNAPLPPEYNVTDTIPAVPARAQVNTDQWGHVQGTIPGDYQQTVSDANDAKARSGNVYYDGDATPAADANGTKTKWTGNGKFTGYHASSAAPSLVKLLDAVSGEAAQEIVSQTHVALTANQGSHYVTGGHPFNGSCNCGAYVTQDDGPVISDPNVFTDASGVAGTTALRSYDSTNCSAGICAGGAVNFTVFGQAHIRYPDQASNADRLVTSSFYGPTRSSDTAAGACQLQLTVPKYSPYINLVLSNPKGVAVDTNSSGIVSKFKMEYELIKPGQTSGTALTKTINVSSNSGTNTLQWFESNLVDNATNDGSGDVDWTIKINKIYEISPNSPDDLKMIASQQTIKNYQAFPVRRNNVYTINIDMVLNEAK